jgi:pre-mRNA-processing factor 6
MEKSLRPKTDKDFGAPPPGYIAGRGRGATGFASGVSREARGKADIEKETDLGDSNYDKFAGYSESLFQSSTYDKEDDEADRIYDMIESRMESRKRKHRGPENHVMSAVEPIMPNLQAQFSEAKTELLRVSEEEWMQLPAAQERLKAKRPQKEFLTNAPDRLLSGGPPGMPSSMMEVGVAKKAVLEVSLNSVSGGMGVDAQEYLEALSAKQTAIADIAEVKKARLLFKSITKSDPTNPSGWIAAARLEEVSGDPEEAKSIVARGLGQCQNSEDLWLAAIRLELNPEKAKSLVANALKQMPRSITLWQTAVSMEPKPVMKIRVLQKALEMNPSSVVLWKSIVNLTQSRSEVLLLLGRAVECCPSSEELWLSFARLSEGQAAQKVLNDARKALPTSVGIWVCAAELAESMGADEPVIENIIIKAVESLAKNGLVKDKRSWLSTALDCKEHRKVPRCIARVVMRGWILKSLESRTPKEVKHEVFSDFDFASEKSQIVATAILKTAVMETNLSARKGVWIKLLNFMLNSHQDGVNEIFQQAVDKCPHSEVLWLMFAKHLWADQKDINSAQKVLENAMNAIEDSENIFIAAARIEETISIDSCRMLLAVARNRCPKSSRIWIKSAQLERQARNTDVAVNLCQDALGRVGLKASDAFKLCIIPVHALLEANRVEEAAGLAAKACESCPTKPAVWLVAADVAILQSDFNKARAILERGRIRHPQDENLWWKGVVVEELSHGKNSPAVKVFIARALQNCSTSGLLWSWAIDSEPAASRHPKCLDALKKCPNDGLVICAVARFFWIEKLQIDKARKWFQNAISSAGNQGQVWVDSLAFEVSLGDDNFALVEESVNEIAKKDGAMVNQGIEWNAFRKDLNNWHMQFPELVVRYSQKRYPAIYVNLNPRISALLSQAVKQERSPLKSE